MKDSLTALHALAVSVASPGSTPCQPVPSLRMLDTFLQQGIGHRLMTVLRIDAAQQWAERIYTSRPGSYSAAGRKSLDAAPQMRRVIAAGAPLLVDGEEAVRQAFADHQRIFSLGCASVLNIPLRLGGLTLGQVNLLHQAGHYAAADSRTSIQLAYVACQLCAPLLLVGQG